MFGRATAIEKNRGRIIRAAQANTGYEADVLVTVHPSFLLRVPDEGRDAAYERFVADLGLAKQYAHEADSPRVSAQPQRPAPGTGRGR